MAPIYEDVCAEVAHSSSAASLEEMRQHNTQRLAELEEKIADAGVPPCSPSVGLASTSAPRQQLAGTS